MQKRKIIGALLELPDDSRDFSHDTVFGSAALAELPTGDFFAGEPILIKDQDYQVPQSDFCAGYAASEVSEDQEMVELNPEYTFVQAKKALGGDAYKSWGLNLRDICKAACDKGFLEQEHYPFVGRSDLDRDFIANPENWPEDLDMLAWEHKKNTYFKVDGPYDTFDNHRSVMWMNRNERRSILTGAFWRESWTDMPGGIIENRDYADEPKSGHAFKIFGQMLINGELYLVAQLSNGNDIGDKGLFYFPRAVINAEFTLGSFTFKDMPKDYARYHQENGLRVDWGPFYKLFRFIFHF